MKPYNIYVTVAYPPDTDTPGLAEENKTKVKIYITQHRGLFLSQRYSKVPLSRWFIYGNFLGGIVPFVLAVENRPLLSYLQPCAFVLSSAPGDQINL